MKKTFCISTVLLLFGSVLTGCPSSTPVTPTIANLAINHGDALTINPVVTLNNVCTETPTFYMASESNAFTGASWQAYSASPTFTLSSSNGTKTVYFKVKNTAGESTVVNETITLNNQITATEETILLPGNVPMVMVWCPAGTFMMGRLSNEQDSDADESPQHQVTLSQGFWMGKYEVTQAQWQAVMGTNPSHFTGDLNRPVEQINWSDVQSFLTAINTLTSKTFRLPSDAEWEYACRAGTSTRFFWGDDASYGQIGNYTWYDTNSGDSTHPVGEKWPNAFGLFDMSGNVWELCQDWYGNYTAGAVTDPAGPASGTYRVLRGGGIYDEAQYCRSADRDYFAPTYKYYDLGIRLAR